MSRAGPGPSTAARVQRLWRIGLTDQPAISDMGGVDTATTSSVRPSLWRRRSSEEIADHLGQQMLADEVRFVIAAAGVATLLSVVEGLRVGRILDPGPAVCRGLASLFEVPTEYFSDGGVADATDALLLNRAFVRLRVTSMAMCRVDPDSPYSINELLCAVLDTVLREQ